MINWTLRATLGELTVLRQSEKNHLNQDYYYTQMNSAIKDSFNYEQEQEIKNILLRAIKVPSQKILSIEVTFWFFKRFYTVIYLGLDKRSKSSVLNEKRLSHIIKYSLHFLITLLLWGATLFVMFSVVYYAKSTLGIDIMPEQHIEDLIPK
jgi:hypothetical protein